MTKGDLPAVFEAADGFLQAELSLGSDPFDPSRAGIGGEHDLVQDARAFREGSHGFAGPDLDTRSHDRGKKPFPFRVERPDIRAAPDV